MIPVGVSLKLRDYTCNKDGSMTDFLTRAKVLKGHLFSKFVNELEMQSPCLFHCMSWLLEKNATCANQNVCDICVERFNLFDDLHATISISKLHDSQKIYFWNKISEVQEKL